MATPAADNRSCLEDSSPSGCEVEQAESTIIGSSTLLQQLTQQLRAPLETLLCYAEYLHGTRSPSGSAAALQCYRDEHERILRLLDDCRDWIRLKNSATSTSLELLELEPWMREFVATQTRLAIASEMELQFECDARLPQTITTDSIRLRQILLSMLSAAQQWSTSPIPRRVELRVSTAAQLDPPAVQFEVLARHVKLHPQALRHAFEPFADIASADDSPGSFTGLELAISRHLTELLGGQLTLDAQATGTRFCLVLPLCSY